LNLIGSCVISLSLLKYFILKKDIQIPNVENVHLAIIHEFNADFRCYDWNAYLVNRKQETLDMVLIMSTGVGTDKKTAEMRHKILELPPNTVAKIEYMPDELLQIDNTFRVSFFINNQIFEKKFSIKKNMIAKEKAQELALFNGSKGFIFV